MFSVFHCFACMCLLGKVSNTERSQRSGYGSRTVSVMGGKKLIKVLRLELGQAAKFFLFARIH